MSSTFLKGFLLLVLWFSINSPVAGQDFDGDNITGTWLTADKTGEINIFRKGNHYFGKIVAGTSDQKTDVHNPDKRRRNDPLFGMLILKDLEFDGAEVWEGGSVYDPKNGKRYSCSIKMVSRDTLKITGYIGFSWIGRSEQWTRIR